MNAGDAANPVSLVGGFPQSGPTRQNREAFLSVTSHMYGTFFFLLLLNCHCVVNSAKRLMSDGPFKPAAQSRHFHGRKHTGLRENLPSTMIRHTDTVRVTGSLGLVLTKVRAIKITRLQKEHTSVNNVGKKSELSQGSKLKNNQWKTDWKKKNHGI